MAQELALRWCINWSEPSQTDHLAVPSTHSGEALHSPSAGLLLWRRWNALRYVTLVMCGVLALGALDLESLPILSATARHALHRARVQMGEILLWSLLGILVVVAALAIVAV